MKSRPLWTCTLTAILFLLSPLSLNAEAYTDIIREMKENTRGPFSGIKWFCKDGTVRPARAGCSGHGGGIQHGELSEAARRLRTAGFPVANVYASFNEVDFQNVKAQPEVLGMMLLERYLMLVDNGWIFSRAKSYRGAFQIEDESAAARNLMLFLLADSSWIEDNYLLLREAARLLPIEDQPGLLSEVRADASRLAKLDSGFLPFRNKMHSMPDPADAVLIREFAERRGLKGSRAAYYSVARKLEQSFTVPSIPDEVKRLSDVVPSRELGHRLTEAIDNLSRARKPVDRIWAYADLLYYLRFHFADPLPASHRFRMLMLSLHTERSMLEQIARNDPATSSLTRAERLEFLLPILQASFGSGVLSEQSYKSAASTVNQLYDQERIQLASYYQELNSLTRVPGQSLGHLQKVFGKGIERFRTVEPLVDEFLADRLHSSPLLALSSQLEVLLNDAGRLAGMTHQIFGRPWNIGVRGLNPGLARGRLSRIGESDRLADSKSKIVLVEHTRASLPPVAGILTMEEGNSLSHVQLLARNLGIPNAVVEGAALQSILPHVGKEVVLAVSPGGKTALSLWSPDKERIFEDKDSVSTQISPDPKRIDFRVIGFIPLRDLGEEDSGVVVGPKAARLGELYNLFPEYVAHGIAIPFGLYKHVLDRKINGITLFEWMKQQYAELDRMPRNSPYYERKRDQVLETIQRTIATTPMSEVLIRDLYQSIQQEMGDPERIGIFVRSDTNVEDLADFSGAGLNLTVPNVVGFQNILKAIRDVWASPFRERPFQWRQDRMTQPEHVYASVLLQRTVPVDKSGVLVTTNLLTGDDRFFTVAINEGVGGVVDNQQAEVVLVNRQSGEIRLLAEATASTRKVVSADGGIEVVLVKVKGRLLDADNLKALAHFVDLVEQRYPKLVDAEGKRLPADIEFGFINNKLALFQIRPYLESKGAQKNLFLTQLDATLKERGDREVDMMERVERGK